MNEHGEDLEGICEQIATDLAEKSYAVVDNFLTADDVKGMRARIQSLFSEGGLKEAGIGAAHQFQVNQAVRKDQIHWIDPNEPIPTTQLFTQRMRHLMRHINRHCYLGLKDFEMHYTMYPKDAYYKRHLDQFKANDHRRLTFIFYLNENWTNEDGGLLRLFLRGDEKEEAPIDILPLAGRLVCFRSDVLEHEVLICHRERYSLTGWLLDQLIELTFLKI